MKYAVSDLATILPLRDEDFLVFNWLQSPKQSKISIATSRRETNVIITYILELFNTVPGISAVFLLQVAFIGCRCTVLYIT